MNNNTKRSLTSRRGNAQGHILEGCIKGGCTYYRTINKAYIEQIPEPFRVTKTERNGCFTGRFTANAQPDFMGVLSGGQAICFEAKQTSQNKMLQSVVTTTQAETLECWTAAGAKTGVCISIKEIFAFIPWEIWKNMKSIYGRKYITPTDAEKYQVKFNGSVLFLDYTYPEKIEEIIKGEVIKI